MHSRFLSTLFKLLILFPGIHSEPEDFLVDKIVSYHNCLRKCHSVGPLKLNPQMMPSTIEHARLLRNLNVLLRSDSELGENVYLSSGSLMAPIYAVQAWYDEGQDYAFMDPHFSEFTEHFTQMVWNSTEEISAAVACSNKKCYIVCNYSPPGNLRGEFKKNVFAYKEIACPDKCKIKHAPRKDFDYEDFDSLGYRTKVPIAGLLFSALIVTLDPMTSCLLFMHLNFQVK